MDMSGYPPGTPKNTAELLALIEKEWSALMQAIATLSADEMVVPDAGGWSVKDNLAHVTTFEQYLLQRHLGGRPPHEVMEIDEVTYKGLDIDGQNAILFERKKDMSVADVLTEAHRSHEQVVATLEAMPFSDLLEKHIDGDPTKVTLFDPVAGDTWEHYEEHRLTIERMFSQSA